MSLESERQRLLDLLATAYSRDEISLEEYERRVDQIQAQQDAQGLAALAKDLPTASPWTGPFPGGPPSIPAGPKLMTIMSSQSFNGSLFSGPYVPAVTLLGETRIDLTEAIFDEGVTELNLFCLMGSVRILVPPTMAVENQVVPIMGESRIRNAGALPRRSSRVLRVTGAVIMGELEIRAV